METRHLFIAYRGTIAGTAFTFVTYLALFILTSATCERNLLYHECLYMYYMDMWGPFVAIGTMCATLCASLSCLLGASRVIHAVGKDNMFGAGFQVRNFRFFPQLCHYTRVLFVRSRVFSQPQISYEFPLFQPQKFLKFAFALDFLFF